MTRKGNRGSKTRASVPRKRKFVGNQYTVEIETEYVSKSAKKIKNVDYEEVNIDANTCKSCGGDVKFSRTNGPGIAFKLVVECPCDMRHIPSSPSVNHSSEVNRRFMYAMRVLGLGLQSMNTFCSLMDISHGFTTAIYHCFLDNILAASKSVFELVQKKAVKEEIEQNTEAGNEPLHLTVSGGGSWKDQGFSSVFGIATLIGKHTCKVLDFIVKSSFCADCADWKLKQKTPEYDEWKDSHAENCTLNHEKMEMDAVEEMFARSEESLGVKYVNYIDYGDTKIDLNPYGDIIVQKKECLRHLQKKMDTQLRALNKETQLPDKLIADLTSCYGLAIVKHSNSAEKMKEAIWGTYYHKCSTDENPQHKFCPEGVDSWCKWRVAEAKGELASFTHDPPLQKDIQDAIKPIYEALSAADLMQRCTGANTQISNESLTSCMWRLAPKHLHCGYQTVQIASYIAANLFNEGYSSLLKTMNVLGIAVGLEAKNFAFNADKTARLAKREQQIGQMQKYEAEEGLLCGT